MKFGSIPVSEAEGAILAHATFANGKRYKKGTVLRPEELRAFSAAGIKTVIAASLEEGDIGETEAAARLAAAFGKNGILVRPPATGRVNLLAESAGVFSVDRDAIARFNAVDPAITIATLDNFTTVTAGQMVATVKIIPFAVNGAKVETAMAAIDPETSLCVHPFRAHRVGLVQSILPGIKTSVLDKTAKATEARLLRSGSEIVREIRTPHREADIAEAIGSLLPESDAVLIFGASAVCDRLDVVPVAIEQAGGQIIRFGMPVDPGNLLVLGEASGKPVICAPGCARSLKVNGFDWVIDRLFAGLQVNGPDISGMGVGGLLGEIASRPRPRDVEAQSAGNTLNVAAVILAAGRSTRMGGPNKLLADFDGKPLIRKVAETALAADIAEAIVVTGHEADKIKEAISGLDVRQIPNPGYAEGLSTSLCAGIGAVSSGIAGAIVVLGDMPGIISADLDRMIAEFREHDGKAIVRASHNGKRGNPVIIPRKMFPDVKMLHGDTGARHLIEAKDLPVADVEIGQAASIDVDTPEALTKAGGKL